MRNTTLGIIVAILVSFGFFLGHVTADPVEIKTVEKEKIVHPDFEFKVGDKKYCQLSTQIKNCEIIALKSDGQYAVKYFENGWGGGDKIILMSPSSILK